MTSEQRRENYLCDITYVTNSELGFDYLRDNLATESNSCFFSCPLISFRNLGQKLTIFLVKQTVEELVMREFNYCIIDEVDSILIDEARTPLIISGSAERPSDRYYKAAKVAAAFEKDIHYTVSFIIFTIFELLLP